MQRVFQNFVEGIRASEDTNALRSTTATGLSALGFDRFVYFVLSQPNAGAGEVVSTYPPAWLERYAKQNFERIDPVLQRIRHCDATFSWDHPPRNTTVAQRQLFDEAAQFGITCGFAVPFHEPHRAVAALAVVSGEAHRSFRRSLDINRRTLQLMALIVHLRARQILGPVHLVAGTELTQREFECLRWAARGKSAWDIGRILGIERRTVSFHLENAKSKLGVRTICQAVARFVGDR